MTPKHGGRIELKLGRASGDSAEYEALLETPTQTFRAKARVGANAGPKLVDLGAWSSDEAAPPPEWLTADARAALKAALRLNQVEGRWPRRMARWRPEPLD